VKKPITPRQLVTDILEDYANNAPGHDDPDEIGDDVTVVRDGQEYTGKVSEIDPKDPQHRLKVSFRGARPPGNQFKPDEIKRDAKGPRKGVGTSSGGENGSSTIPPVASRSGDRGPGSFL
jgi:hypothetical protein